MHLTKKICCALGAAFMLGLAMLAPAARAAGCPNEFLRVTQGSTSLPECMALEMVTPPQKSSQPAYLPFFSLNGERIVTIIETALADTPGYQYYGGDRYVGSRTSEGWEIASTSPQDPRMTAGGRRWGSPAAFTPDLADWAQLGSTQSQYQVGVAQLFEGGLDDSFSPLSPLLTPVDDSGTVKTQQAVEDLRFGGASADLATSVFQVTLPSTGYFVEDPRSDTPDAEPGLDRNSYVAFLDENGEPALELLARDKDEVVYGGRCGSHLGGEGATVNQGAISSDGSRIFFTTRPAQPWDPGVEEEPVCDTENGLRLMKRIATPAGPVITELLPGGPSDPGDDLFQAASADGSKVYLLTPRKLNASDADANEDPCSGNLGASEGCDLYLYDASKPEGERITQASDGEGAGAADVLNSTPAISGDGSRAYFVAQGVLTSDQNPEGATAQAGQPNLYLYEAEIDAVSFIATLSPGDQGAMWSTKGTGFGDAYAAPLYGPGLQGGGDGHVLAFASKAPITADDTDGGFRDVFRYDADAGALERVSKASKGGSDNGPFDADVNPAVIKLIEYNFGEATRWMSEDGQIIAFATPEPLLGGDEDEAANPYVWDAGELGAVSAKLTKLGALVKSPAVAPVGGEVAFSTPTALLPRDGDVVEDIYVARTDGGFPEPMPSAPCDPLKEGSCLGPLSQKPNAAPPPPNGPSDNVSEPARCKKGFVRRKGKCVRKHRKHKARKRAGHKRGGSR